MSENREGKGLPLNCCNSSSSLTSTSLDDGNLCEAKNAYVIMPKKCKDNLNNNVTFNKLKSDQKYEYVFPKRQAIDVQFDDITYKTTSWRFDHKFTWETKTILHGVSGTFKSGHLSVIMGPSGAGKSTLLNILAGFVTRGSEGKVRLNDAVRDQNPMFKKFSAYIPQDEELRLGLTVTEAMSFAANLKLGYNVSQSYKKKQVVEILELLGLTTCHHTMTSSLSGGQKKRLGIALELLSNPPILFLDEPTTGLDSSSTSQCVALLKRLAQEGRTVVCTIHQPSALLFDSFDKLYAIAEGKCIYNGKIKDLVPHLSSLGLECPPYHNPADFLMEIAIGEYGTDVDVLAKAAIVTEIKSVEDFNAPQKKLMLVTYENRKSSYLDEVSPIPAAVIMQFLLLYKRKLLETKRGYKYLFNRLMAHIVIGFVFGYLYKGVGSKANTILGNYVYMYGTMLLLVYTGKMSVTLWFPLEMKILTREHFNRWYKLTPYLLSVILIEIPFQLICCWTYLAISYWLTEQPLDFRLYLFVLFTTLATLCAQSWGYFIGATTPLKVAVFIGPVIACLFSIFGFCITYVNTPVIFRWMYFISYYRAGFHGLVYSIYGFHRNNLVCPEEEMFCPYIDPNKFLIEMDIVEVNLVSNISVIIAIWCIMHCATYLSLWFKLSKR